MTRNPSPNEADMASSSNDDGLSEGTGSSLIDVLSNEERSEDADSTYGDSDSGSLRTSSITSSVLDYEYENGRRYQRLRDGCYMFPNDEREQDRLDMLHHIFLLVQGGRLHIAPLSEPQRVLDLGTGTGIWALDFADEYPGADVLGVDVTPMQPVWVAPNCRFIVDDISQPWIYSPSQPFDYIHQCSMAGSMSDWCALYKEALQHMSPGGYFEVQEFDVWFHSQNVGGLPKDSAILQWQTLIDEASGMIGKRLNCSAALGKALEEAGFEDVRSQVVKTPIGSWPKDSKLRDIGRFLQLQMNDALEAVTVGYLSRVLQWTDQETQVLLARTRNEFNDNSLHLYTYCRFYVGRKIITATTAPTQGSL